MRRMFSVAAIVMIASLVQVEPIAGQDRVASIVSAARKALGGEDKVAAIKTLTAEGPYRRSMGGRDMEGTVALTIERPDKMKRVEDMQMGGMVGGPSIERTSVLAGTTAWDDTQNRGGMGGGMRIMIAEGPRGGPGGAAGCPRSPPRRAGSSPRRRSLSRSAARGASRSSRSRPGRTSRTSPPPGSTP